MKKWIPKGDYCYVILRIEKQPSGRSIIKCQYCKNYYRGSLVDDEMSDNLGGYIPCKRRRIMCRYLNAELFYDDTKECGAKIERIVE